MLYLWYIIDFFLHVMIRSAELKAISYRLVLSVQLLVMIHVGQNCGRCCGCLILFKARKIFHPRLLNDTNDFTHKILDSNIKIEHQESGKMFQPAGLWVVDAHQFWQAIKLGDVSGCTHAASHQVIENTADVDHRFAGGKLLISIHRQFIHQCVHSLFG